MLDYSAYSFEAVTVSTEILTHITKPHPIDEPSTVRQSKVGVGTKPTVSVDKKPKLKHPKRSERANRAKETDIYPEWTRSPSLLSLSLCSSKPPWSRVLSIVCRHVLME
ncbi:hypothetical protein TWF730_004276 [Orbilia blumenaviensis]|uniref:Uncharacterized protein n=1 Tax=Orbilia blumenaviensis TaxID=1796055 RepID=A0AAV9U2R2_9PEZI